MKAAQLALLETITEEDVTQYLVAIHHRDDNDPSLKDEARGRDIDALNDEMGAAGVRVFVGGICPASRARWLRAPVEVRPFNRRRTRGVG